MSSDFDTQKFDTPKNEQPVLTPRRFPRLIPERIWQRLQAAFLRSPSQEFLKDDALFAEQPARFLIAALLKHQWEWDQDNREILASRLWGLQCRLLTLEAEMLPQNVPPEIPSYPEFSEYLHTFQGDTGALIRILQRELIDLLNANSAKVGWYLFLPIKLSSYRIGHIPKSYIRAFEREALINRSTSQLRLDLRYARRSFMLFKDYLSLENSTNTLISHCYYVLGLPHHKNARLMRVSLEEKTASFIDSLDNVSRLLEIHLQDRQ